MSERKLATIREVAELIPIEGADKIELVMVDSWQCVVKKGEFKVGDKCVYIEIDSLLPEKPVFDFMASRKYRVRTIKLRGQLSQGLCLPLSEFPELTKCKINDNVTEKLGIVKYEPPTQKGPSTAPKKKQNPFIKFMCRYQWFRKMFPSKARKSWPEWIPKTDEERIQNIPMVLHVNEHKTVHITEKLDGQSATYFTKKGLFGKIFGVCSRNIWLQRPDNSNWWQVARMYGIEKKLRRCQEDIILQGEIIGPGVANGSGKNIYMLDRLYFRPFNLFINGVCQSYDKMYFWCKERGFTPVPSLGMEVLINDTKFWLDKSNAKSKLHDTMREGIVVRDVETNGQKISFKAINNNFLLKHGC